MNPKTSQCSFSPLSNATTKYNVYILLGARPRLRPGHPALLAGRADGQRRAGGGRRHPGAHRQHEGDAARVRPRGQLQGVRCVPGPGRGRAHPHPQPGHPPPDHGPRPRHQGLGDRLLHRLPAEDR